MAEGARPHWDGQGAMRLLTDGERLRRHPKESRENPSMSKITLEIPESLVEALRIPPGEGEARLRRELAVRLYEKGLLSFGKARELAQMAKWEFHDLLAEEGAVRRYDVQELDGDLKTLEAMG
jgi:predicted HTH domain antitoxin